MRLDRGRLAVESVPEQSSTAKAAFSLERFLPAIKHGSGFGDYGDGGGVVLKRRKARPRWRDCENSPTGPSSVEFNMGRLA